MPFAAMFGSETVGGGIPPGNADGFGGVEEPSEGCGTPPPTGMVAPGKLFGFPVLAGGGELDAVGMVLPPEFGVPALPGIRGGMVFG